MFQSFIISFLVDLNSRVVGLVLSSIKLKVTPKKSLNNAMFDLQELNRGITKTTVIYFWEARGKLPSPLEELSAIVNLVY